MEMGESIEAEEETLEEKTKIKLEDPMVIEEIEIEELAIDGICGVY